ncbi:MAG: hypothetical protein ABIF82_11765 [Planctomycetota bacterium]
MMRMFGAVVLVSVCAAACAAPQVVAGEALKASLSAPAAVGAGGDVLVEAMIVNRVDTDQTFTYQAEAAALTIDTKSLERRVWLAPKAFLLVRWKAKAGGEGEARFALSLGGKRAAERTISVARPKKKPVVTNVTALGGRPVVIELPEPGKKYEIEIAVTAGAFGELAATLDGLRLVTGFATDAVVARSIAPAALGGAKAAELDLLYALQHSSGGWGTTPEETADVRATSWVVFWLGHLAESGAKVDAKALGAAIAYLRKNLPESGLEMQTRILTALAVNGKTTDGDLALVDGADVKKLSAAGRLLAVSAGAALPLPLREGWRGLNVIETSALILCLARNEAAGEALPQLARVVALRGVRPQFGTHGAALYALALSRLAKATSSGQGAAEVQVDFSGEEARVLAASAKKPSARLAFVAIGQAGPGGTMKSRLSVARKAGEQVFCRIIVRPAE